MKQLLIFSLACCFSLCLQAQKEPYNFPVKVPADADFIPTQIKTGASYFGRRINFPDAKAYFLDLAVALDGDGDGIAKGRLDSLVMEVTGVRLASATIVSGTTLRLTFANGSQLNVVLPGGVGVTDGDKGAIVVSSTGTVWNVDTDAITATQIATGAVGTDEVSNGSLQNGDMATMPNNTFKGNVSGAPTAPGDLTVAQVKTALAVTSADIGDFAEAVEDKIGSKVIAGANVTVTYNDGTGETTIAASGGGGDPSVGGDLNGTASNAQLNANVVGTNEVANGSIALVDLAFTPIITEVDGSTTNELQTLSIAGQTLSISSGNSVTLPVGSAIQTLKPLNYLDSLNLKGNNGNYGTTLGDITFKAREKNTMKTTTENRTSKTLLQPAGQLVAENGRYRWNVADRTTAYINLTASGRLFPPTGQKAGGVYTLIVRQDATGGRQLGYDPTAWNLPAGSINVNPYATTTVICSCPNGRAMNCVASSYAPTPAQAFVADFRDSIVTAIFPSEVGNNCIQGLGQTPKYSSALSLGERLAAFVSYFGSWEIVSSSSPPTYSQKWNIAYKTDRYAFRTDSCNFKYRDGKPITNIHAGDFTIYGWVNVGANGSYQSLVAAGTGASNTGLYLRKNSSQQMEFAIMDGTGTFRLFMTSTATVSVSDGWQRVMVRASGGAVKMKIGSAAETTGSFTPTTIAALGSELFQFYGQGGDWWKGWVGNFLIFNRYISDATYQRLDALSQAQLSSTEQGFILPNTSFNPLDVNGWLYYVDARDSTGMYSDASKTTPISASGQDVYAIKSRGRSTYDRDFTTDATGHRPTYISAASGFGGKGAIRFDSLDLMKFNNIVSMTGLTHNYTIMGLMKPDTMTQRTLMTDATTTRLSASTPKVVTGGGGRVHPYQSHIGMAASTRDKFHNEPGGLVSLIPKAGAACAWSLTRRDSLFELVVCNNGQCNITTANANATTNIALMSQVGGAGGDSFKGDVAFLAINANALSSMVRDTTLKSLAASVGISMPTRVEEVPDQRGRVTVFSPLWWGTGPNAVDYDAFGRLYVRNGFGWLAHKKNEQHVRFQSANGGLYLDKLSESGQVLDTICTWRDDTGNKMDRYVGLGTFKNDSIFYSVSVLTGDSYDPNWGLGTDSIFAFIRTINVRTHARGSILPINLTGYSFSTGGWFVPYDLVFNVDTLYCLGYGNQAFTGNYDLVHARSTNGGSTWTIVKTWEGGTLPGSGGQYPEEPGYLLSSDGKVRIVYRNDDGVTGIWSLYSNNNKLNSTSWTTPVKWFDGLSAAWCTEMDRQFVMIQRGDFDTYPAFVWKSDDFGSTWQKVGQVGKYNYDKYGMEHMYGNAVMFPSGNKYAGYHTADRVEGGDLCFYNLEQINDWLDVIPSSVLP